MEIGKSLILIGLSITLIGFILLFSSKLSFFGNLFGDIKFQNENIKFYFPFTSMIAISVVLTIVINILYRLFK
jgi:hypothetical protein